MIELYVLPSGIPDDLDQTRPVVVLDIFRASTSIATALEAGASAVYVAGSMEEAERLRAKAGLNAVMAGERGGLKIDGYDLGNSPREMTAQAVKNRPVIFNSTNGTKLLRRFTDFPYVAVGSVVSLSATLAYLGRFDADPVFCCAGQLRKFTAEDVLAAGLILSRIERPDDDFDDAALLARRLVASSGDKWKAWAAHSFHGRTLASLGLADDLDYCLTEDRFDFVPIVREDSLIVRSDAR